MDFIFSAVSAVFIGLIIAAALAFGFVILVWVMVFGAAVAIALYLRTLLRRWWFLHNNPTPKTPPRRTAKVIEADYVEISDSITDIEERK